MFVCPKRRLTVSMGTPCDKSTVVAFVWRAVWEIIDEASGYRMVS